MSDSAGFNRHHNRHHDADVNGVTADSLARLLVVERPSRGALFHRRLGPGPASLCSLALPQPPEKLPRGDAPIRGWVRVRTLVHGMHDLGMARSELCRGMWQSPLFQA